MATITKYVDTVAGSDTGGSSGGTGTGSSAYATLNYALTQNEQNLVTNTSSLIINCAGNGTADTTAATITGYTTDSTHTITISGNNTTGKWNPSYYTLIVNIGACITVNNAFTVLNGLQMGRSTTNSADTYGITDSGGSGDIVITISNNIIKMNPSNSGSHNSAINCGLLGDGTLIYNNVIYDCAGESSIYVSANHSYYNVYLYNNTIYGGSSGMVCQTGGGVFTVENNICNNATSSDFSGQFDTHATNISQDSTSPDGSSYQTTNGTATFTSTTDGSEDFSLSGSDTAAIARGTNLSGTFTTDITGTTRASTWDIGAFAYFTGTLLQTSFLFRNDDGSETTATSIASQGNNINRNENVNTRVRVLINTTGSPGAQQFQLEWQKVQSGNTTWTKAV